MLEQEYIIFIVILAVVILLFVIAIRTALKSDRYTRNGKSLGLKDALKLDKELARQEALTYIGFKTLLEDLDKAGRFFINMRYVLGIACAYIFGITFLICIYVSVFARQMGWYLYIHLGGIALISLGIGGLCIFEHPHVYFPGGLIHPLIRCIPNDYKRVSTIDKITLVIENGLFIVMGILGVVMQHIAK